MQNGALVDAETTHLSGLNLDIPLSVPDVDSNLLNPRDTWADKDAYDSAAASLIAKFRRILSGLTLSPASSQPALLLTRTSDSGLIEIAQWVLVNCCG